MASFIACPLRFRGALLCRTSEDEAVMLLLRMMAATPNGSWTACPHFGIRDLFEQARTQPGLPQAAVKETNLALQDLGITNYRVAAIAKEPQANRDIDSYVVTIAPAAPRSREYYFEDLAAMEGGQSWPQPPFRRLAG